MKITGVVAEYNPFHRGHAYHLAKSRGLTRCEGLCVVMSGNFVQRGLPAVIDKYARAQMALDNGADLVIELPVCYALNSAQYFARGAVASLAFLGVSDLVFGSEDGRLENLLSLAAFEESCQADYDACLRHLLARGNSYAAASQQAFSQLAGQRRQTLPAGYESLLSLPNNILGLEYLKAIRHFNAPIAPHALQRLGAGYHDTRLESPSLASASAIRRALCENPDWEQLGAFLPEDCQSMLHAAFGKRCPITEDDFSPFLTGALFTLLSQKADFSMYPSVSPAMADKIKKVFDGSQTFTQLAHALKSKDLSYTRICRSLFRILLNLRSLPPQPSYIRVLGFNETGAAILKASKATCPVPVITKPADYKNLLADDVHASNVYNSIVYHKFGTRLPDDFRHEILKRG